MGRPSGEPEVIVRDRICSVCTSRAFTGACGLENPATCALFQMFPQVARAIGSVTSGDIRDYIEAIRRQVCSGCTGQDSAGRCETRQQVQCALDAYLLLVVDAVEEAIGKNLCGAGGMIAGVMDRRQERRRYVNL